MSRRKKGSGQITKVEGRKSPWRAAYADAMGKHHYKFFKTEKEAKSFLADLNANSNAQKAFISKGAPFSAVAQLFLDEKQQDNLKGTSYETLTYTINFITGYIGSINVKDIDSSVIQTLLRNVASDGYSESVLNKTKNNVIRILKFAAAKHYIASMPAIDVIVPAPKKVNREKQAKDNWLRRDELSLYVAECIRTYIPKKYTKHAGQILMVHPVGYRLLLLVHTGIRLGEALALTWADYDQYSQTLTIDEDMVYVEGEKVTQSTKTTASDRVIVLNKNAVHDLECLRKQYDEQTRIIQQRKEDDLREAEKKFSGVELKSKKREIRLRYEKIEQEHKYICGSLNFPFGSSCASSTLQCHKKICKAINLSHAVNVHGLRHTYVTHYYLNHKNDNDFDLATFSRSIGHSNIRTTMEIYAHLDMTENKHVQRSIEDLKDF